MSIRLDVYPSGCLSVWMSRWLVSNGNHTHMKPISGKVKIPLPTIGTDFDNAIFVPIIVKSCIYSWEFIFVCLLHRLIFFDTIALLNRRNNWWDKNGSNRSYAFYYF